MKNVFILFMIFAFATSSWAQVNFSEAPRTLNNGTFPSYQFDIPEGGVDLVSKEWTKTMAGFKGKTKSNGKAKTQETLQVKIPQISNQPVDVFAQILGEKKSDVGTSMVVWVKVDDLYLNSDNHATASEYFKTLLSDFALTTAKTQAQANADAEEKILTNLEKDLMKLRKDNKSYNEAVAKAKEAIDKNEKNIEVNELDQKTTESSIEIQKKAVVAAQAKVKKYN